MNFQTLFQLVIFLFWLLFLLESQGPKSFGNPVAICTHADIEPLRVQAAAALAAAESSAWKMHFQGIR